MPIHIIEQEAPGNEVVYESYGGVVQNRAFVVINIWRDVTKNDREIIGNIGAGMTSSMKSQNNTIER